MKKFLLIPAITLSVVACNTGTQSTTTQSENKPTSAQTVVEQAPAQAVAQTTPKAQGVWIDVRSADEYNAGHLDGAINIVHTDIASQISKVAPNKDEPVNLYCKSGRRAEIAKQELIKLGYTNVTNHGGYEDLLKQGLK